MEKKIKKTMTPCAAVFGLVLSVLLGACLPAGQAGKSSQDFFLEEAIEQNEIAQEDPSDANEEPSGIFVQVCGAVANPGVYSLTYGSRVFEAINLAGGILPDADLASLNQAQALEDGQMVYVYTAEEVAARSEPSGREDVPEQEDKDHKLNINKASVQELMALPGIGPAKAESIVAWREENGAFQAPEDIMKITGIKDGVFSKIKDKIKTN